MEAAMPLMYLPLIMLAGWMQCMLQPFETTRARPALRRVNAAHDESRWALAGPVRRSLVDRDDTRSAA